MVTNTRDGQGLLERARKMANAGTEESGQQMTATQQNAPSTTSTQKRSPTTQSTSAQWSATSNTAPTQGQNGAVNVNFDESMTSAGRLNQMLGDDSALMERSETQGLQTAADRGLLNSSKAAEYAQGAMIDRAQPFAIHDSGQMFQNARQNADAANQFGLNRQQFGFEQELQSGRFAHESSMQDSQQQWQSGENQADREFRMERDRLQAELREAQAQNDFGREQQLNEQLARLEEEAAQAQREYQTQRDERQFGYEQQLTEQQAAIQAERDQRLADLDADAARLQQELQEAQASNDFERTQQLTDQQAEIQQERDQLLFDQQLETMQQEYGYQSDLASQEADNAMREMYAASTGNAWGVMSNNLTDLVAQASSQIDRIQQNPNIAPEDKEQMIQGVIDRRDTDLEFQQSMYNGLSETLLDTGAFPSEGLSNPMREQISSIYQQELGREPDEEGLEYWANEARNMDIDEIREHIAASEEAGGA